MLQMYFIRCIMILLHLLGQTFTLFAIRTILELNCHLQLYNTSFLPSEVIILNSFPGPDILIINKATKPAFNAGP